MNISCIEKKYFRLTSAVITFSIAAGSFLLCYFAGISGTAKLFPETSSQLELGFHSQQTSSSAGSAQKKSSESKQVVSNNNSVKNSSAVTQTEQSPVVINAASGEDQLQNTASEGSAGISYQMGGRRIISSAHNIKGSTAEGIVVVDITVNPEGEVIEAFSGGRGTTTSNPDLKKRARDIALQTKFESVSLEIEQRGTITIIFSFE